MQPPHATSPSDKIRFQEKGVRALNPLACLPAKVSPSTVTGKVERARKRQTSQRGRPPRSPSRCLHGLHADDHFRDGSGFWQRVRPLAQGTARGDPHNCGSRSRHQPDANAINSAQVHTVRPRRLTPQGADAPEGVSSPLRPSHLASPAPLSPRHALHASLTLRFHLRPASACSSTPPHSGTPLCPRHPLSSMSPGGV